MKEMLDIFDENNQPLNEAKDRKIVHEKGLWHREIAVWIINDKNEVLIQKRAASKSLDPNKWALLAGHVDAGESLVDGALRELEEEVGVKNATAGDLHWFDLRKVERTSGNVINNHYKYCYIYKTNLKQEDFVIQEEELSEVKYVSLEKLKNLSDEEKKNYTKLFSRPEFKETIEKIENKIKDIEND